MGRSSRGLTRGTLGGKPLVAFGPVVNRIGSASVYPASPGNSKIV